MSGEFIVNPHDNFKKSMYHVKEQLKDKDELTVKSSTYGAFVSTRVCENLSRLQYVTITGVTTQTKVEDGKRRISLVINLKKSKDFDKLYEQHEERRKTLIAEKEKRKNEYFKSKEEKENTNKN
jgi:hypothetical protein